MARARRPSMVREVRASDGGVVEIESDDND
jgi:hypothetical protein